MSDSLGLYSWSPEGLRWSRTRSVATYSLSGSGTHALTASTTGLQVTITTPSSIGGLGRSNPVARYDQGLIRFSDGTTYWAPVAILGGPQFIPVPANATSFGYAMLGGAVISVTEVIGGTVFFSGSVGPTGPAGPTGPTGPTGAAGTGGALVKLAETIVGAGGAASITFSAIDQTYRNLLLVVTGRSNTAAQFTSLLGVFNADTGANYEHDTINMSGGSVNSGTGFADTSATWGFVSAASATAGAAGGATVTIHDYARSAWHKIWEALGWSGGDATSLNSFQNWTNGRWRNTAAITSIQVKPSAGSFVQDTVATLYGMS